MLENLGVMQGRLSSPFPHNEIQTFPYKNEDWKAEFGQSHSIGLKHIQWIFDGCYCNPLMNRNNDLAIKSLIDRTSVKIRSVIMDNFMLYPIDVKYAESSIRDLNYVLEAAPNIGIETIVIPLEKQTLAEINMGNLYKIIINLSSKLEGLNIKIAFETWLKSLEEMKKFLYGFEGFENVGICYDVGNNSEIKSKGIVLEEIIYLARNKKLFDMHIKEKIDYKTVPLFEGGIGSWGWIDIFDNLYHYEYDSLLTMQLARQEYGKEYHTVKKYFNEIKGAIDE